MPLDREGTLRLAEKLLRQGKLDGAIAEYRKLVDDQPTDWKTVNALGDLYFRAGQTAKAAAEYTRIADHWATEGFFSKAVALYRKILKIKPDDERSMAQLGHLAAQQGLPADAKVAFMSLADFHRARGDRRGESAARSKLADLEGTDLATRMTGIRALVELGETAAAVGKLKYAAADLEDKGKTDEALQLLIEAAKINPSDAELRMKLMNAAVARGDFEGARTYATGAEQLRQIADALFEQGRDDEGVAVLSAAAESSPDDPSLRAELVKRMIARGDSDGARSVLTSDVAGVDAELLWVLAETELREGRVTDGIATLERVLEADPGKRDALVILGCEVATANPDAGFACLDVATRTAIAADEWGSAAAALNEFVSRVPNHIPALARLVEICVDGGLEATLHSAQAQLADAYLVAGSGAEASVIAEDLVAREPWERANIERFRRALTLLGEENIDAIIAERLSGQTPFTSTDFLWPGEPAGTELAPTPIVTEPAAVQEFAPPPPEPPPAVVEAAHEEAVPLPEPTPPTRREPHEIDLSDILGGLKHPEEPATPPQQKKPDVSPETIEEQFKLAGDYLQMGMVDEAIKAFEMASRSPRHRFRAASALARLYVDKGERAAAIEWFERAAEAPTPDPDSHYALLYDLAAALEAQGENARALAVFLELQAEAGDYRDLTVRLGHLTAALKG